jgi:hypothetical protein
MQVKAIHLFTGADQSILYPSPPVLLEVTLYDAKSRKVLAMFEVSGNNTQAAYGG